MLLAGIGTTAVFGENILSAKVAEVRKQGSETLLVIDWGTSRGLKLAQSCKILFEFRGEMQPLQAGTIVEVSSERCLVKPDGIPHSLIQQQNATRLVVSFSVVQAPSVSVAELQQPAMPPLPSSPKTEVKPWMPIPTTPARTPVTTGTAQYAGVFVGRWDTGGDGAHYTFSRKIVLNPDLKTGTDTIRTVAGEEKTFRLTGEVIGESFVGKNYPGTDDGWMQDTLTMTLSSGGTALRVVAESQGVREEGLLYREGYAPKSSARPLPGAWPRVVQCRRLFVSSIPSLGIEPVWSYDGRRILVRVDNKETANQRWISADDGALLDKPTNPIGWDPRLAESGLIASCLLQVTGGATNFVIRLSDRDGKMIHDYPVGSDRIGRPAISPDGKRVAFQRRARGETKKPMETWRLSILDLATGNYEDVRWTGVDSCTSPCWFADGERLVCYLSVSQGPSGIGIVEQNSGKWQTTAGKSLKGYGFPAAIGPAEECVLTAEFNIENRCDGTRRFKVDAVALNLRSQRMGFLGFVEAASQGDDRLPTVEELTLSPDGTRLAAELHRPAPPGEKGFTAELWVANLEWMQSVPDATKYMGRNPVAFRETFDDNRANWDTHRKEGEGFRLIRNGRYEFLVEKPSTFMWGNATLDYQDFDCQVSARRIGGPEVNQYGILFRFVDNENFYRFGVSSGGNWTLDKWVDGEVTVLQRWAKNDAILGGDKVNILRVKCEGDSISLYANGNTLIEVRDASLSQGKIALFAGTDGDRKNVEIAFDDFTVSPRTDNLGIPLPMTGSPRKSNPAAEKYAEWLRSNVTVGSRVVAARSVGPVNKGWVGTYYGLVQGAPPVCVAWDNMRNSSSMATPAVPQDVKGRVYNVDWRDIRLENANASVRGGDSVP